jgi:membrane fusion protein (multidrug efflux system)
MKLRIPWRRLTRGLVRGFLLLIVPPAAAAVGIYYYAIGGRYVETENAYVKANIVAVSAKVSGRVVWVGVDDNQPVEEGQLLFKVDPMPFEIALAGTEAEMAEVRTELERLRAEHREAEVALGEFEERVRFLERQYERQEKLRARGVGSEEKYDEAHHNLETARQRVRLIRQRIVTVLASLGGDVARPIKRHPRYLKVKADRDQAALDLEETSVYAAASGIVSNMKLQAGEFVDEGTPIFTLIETAPVWIEANLKETQLTHVRETQRATIVVDAYPDRVWRARVASISPATGAEFALLPPQNATGNWVKVVQRVPVRLEIDAPGNAPPLRAGMTVQVSIDTERERDVHSIVRQALAWTGQRQ